MIPQVVASERGEAQTRFVKADLGLKDLRYRHTILVEIPGKVCHRR